MRRDTEQKRRERRETLSLRFLFLFSLLVFLSRLLSLSLPSLERLKRCLSYHVGSLALNSADTNEQLLGGAPNETGKSGNRVV